MAGAVLSADLFHRCRTAGVTVRSAVDGAIACIAMGRDAELLHDDVDHVRIGAVEPRLRLL